MQRPPFITIPVGTVTSYGISPAFARLSPTQGQVTHALLTRAPLYSPSCPGFLVRLACVRHAASVRSEPGSNSPVYFFIDRDPKRITPLFYFQRTNDIRNIYILNYNFILSRGKNEISEKVTTLWSSLICKEKAKLWDTGGYFLD